jgi:putative oxidoreductase
VVFTILATAIGHRFWEISDPAVQPMQMIMFLKNIAIIGGLLQVWAGGVGRFAIGPLTIGPFTIGRFTIGRPGIGDGSAG